MHSATISRSGFSSACCLSVYGVLILPTESIELVTLMPPRCAGEPACAGLVGRCCWLGLFYAIKFRPAKLARQGSAVAGRAYRSG